MSRTLAATAVLALALLTPGFARAQESAPSAASAARFQVDGRYYRLDNGLKVVLAPDASAPTVSVGVYYGVGFRVEPHGRTGFAHLFEHLMFQGSENLPDFFNSVAAAGGQIGGSTRFDFTRYWETAPSSQLEFMLWGEADRMARPVIRPENLANQKGVVSNEVRAALHNQPYGGWTWLDLPQAAFSNWQNAHNFYGDLKDIEAATMEEAEVFRRTYYTPDNAVLVVVGDFHPVQVRAWIARDFNPIPAGPGRPPLDIAEPVQVAPRLVTQIDPLATQPAWVGGWRIPDRGTPEWFAMGLIDQLAAQGADSRLQRELVASRGLATRIEAGINVALGTQFSNQGPTLWAVGLVHDRETSTEQVTDAVETVLADLRNRPVSTEELSRARTKLRMSLFSQVNTSNRLGLLELLAAYALFDDDPLAVNQLEDGFAAVTPELVQQTARTWLAPERRTVLQITPGKATEGAR